MTESELLAMRGFLDIILGSWLIRRFWDQSTTTSSSAKWVQLIIISLIMLLLQVLGVWSWREILAVLKSLPIIWPLVALLFYLLYRNYQLNTQIAQAEFEIDWRKEYQEVLLETLEKQGATIPPIQAE